MNPCESCLHYSICMEKRGRCTEYKDLEMIQDEIKMLNENFAETPRTTATSDAGSVPKGSRRGREVHTDDRQATEATHDAWKVAAIEAEDEETANTTTQGDREKGKEHKAGC